MSNLLWMKHNCIMKTQNTVLCCCCKEYLFCHWSGTEQSRGAKCNYFHFRCICCCGGQEGILWDKSFEPDLNFHLFMVFAVAQVYASKHHTAFCILKPLVQYVNSFKEITNMLFVIAFPTLKLPPSVQKEETLKKRAHATNGHLVVKKTGLF